jgi:hypothetical protein
MKLINDCLIILLLWLVKSGTIPDIKCGEFMSMPDKDIDQLPKNNPRQWAKEQLLKNHLVGVAFDPRKTYPFDNTRPKKTEIKEIKLKYHFALVNDEFYDGAEIFKDSDAYKSYKKLTQRQKKALTEDEMSNYFTKKAIGELKTDKNFAGKVQSISSSISIDPFDERVQKAKEYFADIIAKTVHPRIIRNAIRCNIKFIAADGKNVQEFIGNVDERSHVAHYDRRNKNIICTVPNLSSNLLKPLVAHESGHHIDDVRGKSQFLDKYENGVEQGNTLSTQRWQYTTHLAAYYKRVKQTLDRINALEYELYEAFKDKSPFFLGSVPLGITATKLVECISRNSYRKDRQFSVPDTLKILLVGTRHEVMKGLPPKDRYYFDVRQNRCIYQDDIRSFVQDNEQRINKEALLTYFKNIFFSYPTQNEQMAEIPAAFYNIVGQHGMQFARVLMPELYREVMDISALNRNLRDDPARFDHAIENRGTGDYEQTIQQLLQSRRKHKKGWVDTIIEKYPNPTVGLSM